MRHVARPILFSVVLCGCAALSEIARAGPPSVVERRQEVVEVSPGRFLTLSRIDTSGASRFVGGSKEEATELVIPWNEKSLRWKGRDIPVTLREFDGKLHMIAFDRHTDFDKPRLRYFRQNDDGTGFDEIAPAAFPPRVAAQNLWLGDPDAFARGIDGRKIFQLDLALHLDPDDPYFSRTLTAAIWCQLHAGLDYSASRGLPLAELQPMLRDFAAKHPPIRLRQIVTRATTSPAATE